jgi:hypothetical protein
VNKIQHPISFRLTSLWCLGALSPSIFYILLESIIQPRFGLPDHKWLYLTLLAGFSACACAATLLQISVTKRIGLVLLAALVMAMQLAAIVIYSVSHFPEPT